MSFSYLRLNHFHFQESIMYMEGRRSPIFLHGDDEGGESDDGEDGLSFNSNVHAAVCLVTTMFDGSMYNDDDDVDDKISFDLMHMAFWK